MVRQVSKQMLVIFLLVWGVYTATLNSWNAKFFGLQAATVAALAEHGKMQLVNQVLPGFTVAEGDETFRYKQAIYPMKQPGQTVLGAIVYTPLMIAGFYFLNHFDYVVHIVTFLTSSLMMAGVSAGLYLYAIHLTKNNKIATLTACTYAFGTITWPYAGVMHHDIYATFFVALSILTYLSYLYIHPNKLYLIVAGAIAAFALFFSMLPVTIPIAIGIALLINRGTKSEVLTYLMGLTIGLLPSLLFNYFTFGDWLAFPNIAGKVADTIPFWSPHNLIDHLYFFLLSPLYSLFSYSPVLILGIIGIASIPSEYRHVKRLFILIIVLLISHVSTQETFGDYQYGPRYLLPILPVICMGIPFVLMSHYRHKWFRIIFGILLGYSVTVAMIGSVQTVMFPVSQQPITQPGQYGPWDSFKHILARRMPTFRMLPLGLGIIFLSQIISLSKKRKENNMNK